MLRFAWLAALAGCGASSKPTTSPGAGTAAPARMAKKIGLSWGIAQGGDSSDVFLQVTDETGAQVSYPAGTYPGTCKQIVPALEMHVAMAVQCTFGATGWQIQAAVREDQVIVLKLHADQGATADPMSREEVTRVKAPPGAAIEVAPLPNNP